MTQQVGQHPISREELEAAVLRQQETIEDQQTIIRNERQEKADLRRQIDGQASEIQAHVVRGNELVRDVEGLREENLELRRQAEEKDAQIERLTAELNARGSFATLEARIQNLGNSLEYSLRVIETDRLREIKEALDRLEMPFEDTPIAEVYEALLASHRDNRPAAHVEPVARQVRANVSSSYVEAGEIPPFLRRQGLR